MTIIDFIEWVQSPGVYEWAMRSCREAFYNIFPEAR